MQDSYYTQFHTSAEVKTIFSQVFGARLLFCGFETIGPIKWVQETGRGFKYVFHLVPQHSGYSYLPCGAISIDFVPKLTKRRFKILPNPKHVAIHHSFDHRSRQKWMIEKNREGFRDKVEMIAAESVTEITAWFHKFKSISNIVEELDRDKSEGVPTGFYSFPLTVLAYSFALGRLRRTAEARREFENALESSYFDSSDIRQLREMFEAEIGGSDL